jgi:hypothetical protein
MLIFKLLLIFMFIYFLYNSYTRDGEVECREINFEKDLLSIIIMIILFYLAGCI